MASFIAQKLAAPYLKEFFQPGFEGPSVSTFTGTVTIRKMKFKPEALDFLNLPVQIKIGYVGEVIAKINYSALMSSNPGKSPVLVSVKDVYVVVGPKAPTKIDPEKYVKDMIAAKLSSLGTWQDAAFPADKDAQAAYGMADRIQDNLCVSVENVHLRFESTEYAFGMSLKGLSIHTTDEEWKNITPPKEPKCIFRKLEMRELSLYLNTKDEIGGYHKMATTKMLKDVWNVQKNQNYKWTHLIPPISAELRVAQEKADEEKLAVEDKAKMRAELILEPLGFTLSRMQYNNMLKLLEDVSQQDEKPTQLPDYNEKPTNEGRDKYIAVYKKLFEDTSNGRQYPKESKEEKKLKVEFEKKWSFQDVVKFRLAAYEVAKKELETEDPLLSEEKRNSRTGITGGLKSLVFSGPGKALKISEKEYLNVLDSKSEAEKRAQAQLDKMNRLPPKYVHTSATITFKRFFFTMKDSHSEIVEFQINDLSAGYQARPKSMLATVRVQDMQCEDHFTKKSQHPYFIKGIDSKTPLVDIVYETNPPDNTEKLDSVAKVRVDSVDVVVIMGVLNEISFFFTPPEPVDLTQLREHAVARLAEIQKDASQRLMEAIENRTRNLIDVQIKAPCIIVPESVTIETSPVLVIDLGTVLLKSRLAPEMEDKSEIKKLISTANQNSHLTERYRNSLYDSFTIELRDLSIFLSHGTTWRLNDKMVIISPFSIPVEVDNAISPAMLSLPAINAKASLTDLKLHISSRRVRRLLSISEAISASTSPPEKGLPVAEKEASPEGPNSPKSKLKEDEKKQLEEEKKKLEDVEKKAQEVDFRNTKYNIVLQMESMSLLVSNDLGEISDAKTPAYDVIALRVGKIELKFRQREYDMYASLSVQSISLEDKLQTHGEAFRYIVSTNEGSKALRELVENLKNSTTAEDYEGKDDRGRDVNFISMNVSMIQPEAKDMYDNCNSTLNLKVGTLVLATNRETIAKMAYFFQYQLMPPSKPKDEVDEILELEPEMGPESTTRLQDNEETDDGGNTQDYLNKAMATYKTEHEKTQKRKLSESNEVFLTKVDASFESLQVVLASDGKLLGRALVDRFQASFTDSDEHKRAKLSLDGIWIRDLTGEAPLYPFMIECKKGDKLVDINLHMRNKQLYTVAEQHDVKSSYLTVRQTPKITLKANISGVRVTFLNRFVQEMSAYPSAILAEMSETPPPKEFSDVQREAEPEEEPGLRRNRTLRLKDHGAMVLDQKARDPSINVGEEADEKVERRIKAWKKHKGFDTKTNTQTDVDTVFDFYKVDLQLRGIMIVVPQASKSTDDLCLTMKRIQISNCLSMESPINTIPENTNQSIPFSKRSDNLELPHSFHSMLSLDSRADVHSEASDEFYDCRDLKPNVFTKWDVYLDTLSAVTRFDNKEAGITRDKPLPLFEIRDPSPESGQEGQATRTIAARVIAFQTIPQLKPDPLLYPALVVVTQVATINMIASKIQMQFLLALSSKNLSEKPVVMSQSPPSSTTQPPSGASTPSSGSSGTGPATTVTPPASEAKEDEKKGGGMRISVRFNDLVVKLVEDPTQTMSRTLGLAWNIHLNMNQDTEGKIEMNGILKNVTMFNTVINKGASISEQLKSLKTGHYIMDPFDMTLDLQQGTSKILPKESLMTAKLHGGLVNLRLTYQDYKLVMDSLGFLSTEEEPTEEEKKKQEAEGKTMEKKSGVAAATEILTRVIANGIEKIKSFRKKQGGYLLDPKDIKDPFPGTFESMEAIQSYGEQDILAIFDGIHITLINNVTGIDMPFASFELSRFKTKISGFAHQQNLRARLGILVRYYNQKIEDWEPMIEPFHIQADMRTVAGHGKTVQLRMLRPLYINLTRAMVDALTSTLNLVSAVESKKNDKDLKQGKMLKYSTHMLENLTDVKIRYSFTVNDFKGDSKKETNSILPGEQAPLFFPEAQKKFDVSIEMEGWGKAEPFDMNDIHSEIRKLEPEGKGKAVSVVFESRVVGGIKVFSVHSTISVKNHTVATIECGDARIKPQETIWVPLSLSQSGFLTFRPVHLPGNQRRSQVTNNSSWETGSDTKEISYSNCEALSINGVIKGMKSSSIPEEAEEGIMLGPPAILSSASPSGKKFHLALSATMQKDSSVLNLILRAPLVVENVLACGANVLLTHKPKGKNNLPRESLPDESMSTPLLTTEKETKTMAHSLEIRLERAGVYEVFCFPSADECMMCIKLDGYSASFSDSIQMIEKEAATVGISVKDAKDSDCALTVHCDLVGEQRTPEDTPITAWRATLFVPYWVFDATGLGLKLSPDKYTLGAESEEVSLKNSISSKMEKFAEWKGIQEAAFAVSEGKKAGVTVESIGEDEDGRQATMLSFGAPGDTVRVAMSAENPVPTRWSDYISLDSAESQVVNLKSRSSADEFWRYTLFQVGVVSTACSGKFSRTRVVTLHTRHVIVNKLDCELEVREQYVSKSFRVRKGGMAPFHFLNGGGCGLVQFRLLQTQETQLRLEGDVDGKVKASIEAMRKWEWSGSFRISEPCDFGLIVRAKDSSEYFLIRVEVRAADGTLFIVINQEHPRCPPFRVVNRCSVDRIRFCQHKVNKWTEVPPLSVCTYSWDQPLGIEGKLAMALEVSGDRRGARVYALENYGALDRFVLSSRLLYVYLFAEGPTKVLVISDLPNPDVHVDPRSSPAEQRKQEEQLSQLARVRPVEVLQRRSDVLRSNLKILKSNLERLESKIERLTEEKKHASTKQIFRVKVIEASSVSAVKVRGKSDVYALLVFNGEKRKTRVLRRNLNPWFEQYFDFDVTPKKGDSKDTSHPLASQLRIALFSRNLVAPDDFLGGVVVDLTSLRAKIDITKDKSKPVEIQRWLPLESLRHISRTNPTRIHLLMTFFPSEMAIYETDKNDISGRLMERVRCHKTLRRQLRRAIRQEKFDQGYTLDLRRTSAVAAPINQILFSLKITDSKLNFLRDEKDTRPGKNVTTQGIGGDEKCKVICLVSHRDHKRMCVLHDPKNPGVHDVGEFEFYVDEDEVNDTDIRLECFAHLPKSRNGGPKTIRPPSDSKVREWVPIGFYILDLRDAPTVNQKPFETRAAELREDDPERGEDDDDGCRVSWEKLVIPEDATTTSIPLGGQLQLELEKRPAPPPEERSMTVATVSLGEFGVSMIDSTPEEIFFFQLKGLVMAYEDAPIQTTMEFSVFHIQLDNCLKNAQFPIVLAPEAVPPSLRKPLLQLSMHQSKTKDGVPVSIYQYASFLMQKLKLSVEERILLRLMSYASEFAENQKSLLGLDDGQDDGSEFVVMKSSSLYPIPESGASKMFFSFLQLHPIAIDISLELSSELRSEYATGGGIGFNPLKWIRNAAGTAIDIDEAPLRLNALTIEDAYGSTSTLLNPIIKHYTSQVIREAYKVLGSLEILGNPVQLVGNLGEGVMDFFYEPAMGLVSSPQEFGRGLARGTTSLLKHTVTGIFGAASKVTGKIAEGIAVLGMDDEFQQQQRMQARKPPRHIGEGLMEGSKSVILGVYRGVTGVVTDPYHGYRSQGWKGFCRGVGTGILGIGLKPAAGTVSAASKILQGIGNTATCCDDVFENNRARFPRYIPPDGKLRPYNPIDAAMVSYLRLFEIKDLGFSKEEKRGEVYVQSFKARKGYLVVSNLRLVMLPLSLYRDGMRANAVKARGKLKPVFTVLWDEMKAMVYVANSVVVQSRVKKPVQFKLSTEEDAKQCCDELNAYLQVVQEKGKSHRGAIGAVSDVVKKIGGKINVFNKSTKP